MSLLGQKVYIFFFALFHPIGQRYLPNLLDHCLEGEEATGRKIHNHEEANQGKFMRVCACEVYQNLYRFDFNKSGLFSSIYSSLLSLTIFKDIIKSTFQLILLKGIYILLKKIIELFT